MSQTVCGTSTIQLVSLQNTHQDMILAFAPFRLSIMFLIIAYRSSVVATVTPVMIFIVYLDFKFERVSVPGFWISWYHIKMATNERHCP